MPHNYVKPTVISIKSVIFTSDKLVMRQAWIYSYRPAVSCTGSLLHFILVERKFLWVATFHNAFTLLVVRTDLICVQKKLNSTRIDKKKGTKELVISFLRPFFYDWSTICGNRFGSHRQKQPDFRQHLLNSLPEPQGQGSLRPSFSTNSLLPWTMRSPFFTCVSEGKPFFRLLVGSKGIHIFILSFHHTSPCTPDWRDIWTGA